MAEKTNKLSNDWIRCQSKSRPDRYYLFNKKTGETNWCSDVDNNTHLKTVSASNGPRTPAQDRMKRLQNQLEKKRLKEAAAEHAKCARRGKQEQKKDNRESTTVDARREEKIGNHEDETLKSTLANESQTPPKKAKKDLNNDAPTSSKSSSVQDRQLNPLKRSFEESKSRESIKKCVPDSFSNGNKTSSSVHPPSKPNAAQPESNKLDRRSKEVDQRLGLPVQRPESLPKTFEVTSIPAETKRSAGGQPVIKYDEKKNQKKSEDKSNLLSKIKGFCNQLLNANTKPIKRKQADNNNGEKISLNSKPSFKHKKLGNKSLLRGFSCDIECESVQISESNRGDPQEHTSQVNQLSSVPKESANDRLQRLRKSLQQQQSLQTLPSRNSVHISDEVVFSPNESDCEPMDWEPIDLENDTTCSATTSRTNESDLSTVSEYNDAVSENIVRLVASKKQGKDWKRDYFYFVIDTNVFIENPTFIEELTTMKLCDTFGTVIYIPYCVLQELDKLKIRSPSESVRIRTTRAIKLLNKAFEERNPQFQAQSAADEGVHMIKVTSPDDSILNCCLQVKQQIDNLLLLTEDVNLQSKAMCNDILVSTKSDLISLH